MFFPLLQHRRPQAEWMDAPGADPQQLVESLRFIRRVNAWLGYTRLMVEQVARLAGSSSAGRTTTVLDVATGSADVPVALLRWADTADRRLNVIAVDLHSTTLRFAAGDAADARLRFVRADALHLPFESRSVDYVISAMFLHHLSEADAVEALREMARVSVSGVIVSDLLRHRRAYGWISLFTLFSGPMVKHDARVSVAQAFTADEVRRLFEAAGLPGVRIERRFGHRFVAVARFS